MAESAVADTSPLIILSRANRLPLLQMASERVVVPAPVLMEITAYGRDDPTVRAIEATVWLARVAAVPIPERVQALGLGIGESSVIAWALAHPGREAIIDDLNARRQAAALGIAVTGCVGLVLRAKRRGIVARARPVLELLQRHGLYLSRPVLDRALSLVGE